ncbi:GNAT family N-acetyltransferase [Nocardioides dubius]|uniref:Acetyltransferase (GNAT) family protein n=1 Tax=Nocardioides dubius TaxID=317019 RepID=A0ABP4EIY0_9ACTN
MITWSWRDRLEGDDAVEVAALLAESVDYDAEAGFSTARPDAPASGAVHHLVVTMPPAGSRGSAELDRLPDVRVVAYLRLDRDGATAQAELVVRPAFRSRGIGTLLLEQLALAPDGWASMPGLVTLEGWSHGAHPAADRMRSRFGGVVEHAVFKTLRPLGGSRPFVAPVAAIRESAAPEAVTELVPGHRAAMAPGELATLGLVRTVIALEEGEGSALLGWDPGGAGEQVATLTVLPGEGGSRTALRELTVQALLVLQGAGVRMVQAYVDALDDVAVSVARELEFVHDQSDLRYRLALG